MFVVHPKMTVSDFIHGDNRRWNEELLETLEVSKDIFLIQSFFVSQSRQRDSYCWSYMNNGQYTVTYEY